MQVTVEIPDEFVEAYLASAEDPARVVLEDAAVEAYREHRITAFQLRTLLGLETRDALDGYLKAKGVFIEYSNEDLDKQRDMMARILHKSTR